MPIPGIPNEPTSAEHETHPLEAEVAQPTTKGRENPDFQKACSLYDQSLMLYVE